jgi:hypothetical protein
VLPPRTTDMNVVNVGANAINICMLAVNVGICAANVYMCAGKISGRTAPGPYGNRKVP